MRYGEKEHGIDNYLVIPVWLFLGGTIMYFILDSIKQIADRTWLKYTIVGVIAVVVVILLCVQYIGG
ncbi:MAG: hypothetical protein IJF03_05290 [Lachnospiraceae bacterium]|nr:hypothetical protein [Lachnospiraceae bacterium]